MPKSNLEKKRAWIKKLQAFEASGLSPKNWCAKHHEKLHIFKYWQSKLKQTNQTCSFEEIKTEEPRSLKLTKQQWTIEIPLDTDEQKLKATLQTLASC